MTRIITAYIIGPYSDDPGRRTVEAVELGRQVLAIGQALRAEIGIGGIMPVVPHLLGFALAGRPHVESSGRARESSVVLRPSIVLRPHHGPPVASDEWWYEATEELMRRCDIAVVSPAGVSFSRGSTAEIAAARAEGIPIAYAVEAEAIAAAIRQLGDPMAAV